MAISVNEHTGAPIKTGNTSQKFREGFAGIDWSIKLGADPAALKPITKQVDIRSANEKKVAAELIDTWQPVAAIAYRCDLPVKAVLVILVEMYNQGLVKCSRVRIDGHNKVFLFKRVQHMKVMGMHMVVDNADEDCVQP